MRPAISVRRPAHGYQISGADCSAVHRGASPRLGCRNSWVNRSQQREDSHRNAQTGDGPAAKIPTNTDTQIWPGILARIIFLVVQILALQKR